MNPASRDIATLLEGESSLGLTFATNLFIGREYDSPSNCVTLYDGPGGAPYLALSGKQESGRYSPRVLVRVRNIKYDEGYALAFAIMEFLHGIGHTVVGGTTYDLIRAINDPQLLEWDENNRVVFIVSFDIQRR